MRLVERRLERVKIVGGAEALDGGDLVPFRLDGEGKTRSHRFAVQQHRARAAHAVLTSDVRSGEPQVLAEKIAQEQTRLHAPPVTDAVDGNIDEMRPAQGA
jgi:hypothetical protein